MDREPPSFKIGDRVYFKNKQLGKRDLNEDLDTALAVFCVMDITYTLKIKLLEKQGHAMSKCLNHQQNSGTWTHNLAELGDTLTTLQFANYHAQQLKMNTLLMYIVACK